MNARIEWHGDLAKTLAKQGSAAGLSDAAEALKEASNAVAPTETGHLVASSGTDVDAQSLTASVFYGPDGAPKGGKNVYAIVRHEAMRQGGAPKYLERPLLRFRQSMASTLAAAIRKVLS